MAFTKSNIKRTVTGDLNMYTGTFTSASGDSALTIAHGYNYIADTDIALNQIGAQNPTVSTTSGTTTVTWDDTKGASGTFCIIGK
jgi:hypothetical protein